MEYVDFNGARIWVEALGSEQDPAVILIHSGIATARMWDPVAPELAATHYVIRYDSRQFGRSVSEDVEFSEVDDLCAVMDAVGVGCATLVGASRGGQIALDAALAQPGRVSGVVTIGSSPGGFPEVTLTDDEQAVSDRLDELESQGDDLAFNRLEAELWAVGTTRELADLAPELLETLYSLNLEKFSHVKDGATKLPASPPAFGRVAEITVPALVVVGVHDLSPLLAAADHLMSTLPNATLVRFPDCAHSPSIEKPDEFAAILLEWLSAHSL